MALNAFQISRNAEREDAVTKQTCSTCVVSWLGVEVLMAVDDFLMSISFHNVLVLINCPVN